MSLYLFFSFLIIPFSYANELEVGSWKLLGLENNIISSVSVDPQTPSIIYAATIGNGIFKSVDYGDTWTPINNGLPTAYQTLGPIIILNDTHIPSNVYAVIQVSNIYKSTNGGQTWNNISNEIKTPYVMDLAINPNDSNILFAAVYSHCGGVWKSLDGGTTWSQNSPNCDNYRILFDPINPNTIYVGGKKVYKSVDNGITWNNTNINDLNNVGGVRGIAIDPIFTNNLYIGTEVKGIYKSTDGGSSWVFLEKSPQAIIGSSLISDPEETNVVYAGTLCKSTSCTESGIHVSTDGGDNWKKTSDGIPDVAIRNLTIPKNYSNFIFASTDKGIYFASITRANKDLNIPLYKQIDNAWSNEIYDSANIWSPNASHISNWGCALTSAAMILNYYGYKKLPDGQTLDPGSLNTWLMSQKDGYVGNGLLNWVSLSRLSKNAKEINNLNYNALEYSRIPIEDKILLTNDLENNIPNILEVPGHFIVAKGINKETYNINDPFYDRKTLSDGYNNSFISSGRFIKSNTDLSYIILISNPEITINLLSKNVDNYQEFISQPIINPFSKEKNGSDQRIIYISKPNSDIYLFKLTSKVTNKYTLKLYLYDSLGNVKIFNKKGDINRQGEIISVKFNKESLKKTTVGNKRISIFKPLSLKKLNVSEIIKNLINTPISSILKLIE